MIRITKLSGTYYGKEIDLNDTHDLDDIEVFIDETTPVILVNDLNDLIDLDIDPDEVTMV